MLDIFLFALICTLVCGVAILAVTTLMAGVCWLLDFLVDMDPWPRLAVVLIILFGVFLGLGTAAKVAHNVNVPINNSCELEER